MKTNHFQDLLDIMSRLRKECPWDKKQTIDTLRSLTIEETYELSEAIINKKYQEIKKELGDLLLHIVFYSQIGSELTDENHFDIDDVIVHLNKKLIKRHPHIYGNIKVENAEDVKNNWEKIKLEGENRKSVLEGVPNSLPSMIKAYRIQEKAHGIGFDWNNTKQVWNKVEEEIEELKTEIKNNNDKSNIEMEFGDVLFALINYGRFIGINPDNALEISNKKFILRFKKLEQKANELGYKLSNMTLEELDAIWDEVKKEEKNPRK